MRRTYYVLMILCALGFGACSFSVGSNKDFSTGLSYGYNGFAVDEVLLVGPDNTVMSNNEVALDTKVAILAQGIRNYELRDGKAFPGVMLKLTDKAGNAILDEADLFASSDGFSTADAGILRGTVTVGNPMKSGETYTLMMRIWDKNKPANELTATVDLVVK